MTKHYFFFKINFLSDKFDVQHCVSLKCTVYYFYPFIFSIVFTLHNYSTILFPIFIILYIRALCLLITCYKFVPINIISVIHHLSSMASFLVTTILLCFPHVYFFQFPYISDIIQYTCPSLTYLAYHNVLTLYPCCYKREDVFLSHG